MRAEDRLIRASILDFRAKLENQCKVFPVYTLLRASIHDFRAKLENRCRVLPVYALLRASILDFKSRLGNRCKVVPVYTIFRASILDFRAKLENRCRVLPVYALLRASILDFRARLGNRCKVFPVYILFRASILDFKPRLANRCRGEWFRLLQPSRTQAGTGCHEGGIILSTKPPERHLSLPQQRSASDSNLRSGKEEWFACCVRGGNDLPRPILIFVASKKKGFACSIRRERRQGQDAMKAA